MTYQTKQAAFQQNRLDNPEIILTLSNQKDLLVDLRYQLQTEATEVAVENARQLDTDLLIYACTRMIRSLESAATRDCAQLIAASVMRLGDADKCQDDWEKWLNAASCWPRLAQSNWFSSQSGAIDLVIEQLGKTDGLKLDNPEGRDIIQSVRGLQLADLLAPEDYQTLFPKPAIEEADGGEEGENGGKEAGKGASGDENEW